MDSKKKLLKVFTKFSPDFKDLYNYTPRMQGNGKLHERMAFIYSVGQKGLQPPFFANLKCVETNSLSPHFINETG